MAVSWIPNPLYCIIDFFTFAENIEGIEVSLLV